jgi:DNA-binding transcriptional ArsR family regulator
MCSDSATPPERPRRRVSDPRTLRALTHPLRLALLELLTEGPLTATEAGERLGESPANASFHLRTLAKYGFVEEAPGGTGRQRPWRRVPQKTEIDEDALPADGRAASFALLEMLGQRDLERVRTWSATRSNYPAEWRNTAFNDHAVVHLTSAELARLEETLLTLLGQYTDRDDPEVRPPGTLPIAVAMQALPLRPPTDADEAD